MSVSIQVCVRCRPFSVSDRLAVLMEQTSPTDGEITLLNTTYTTTRFGFTWAWWSAYGWERSCDERDAGDADRMKLINQDNAYSTVGTVIKKDLMEGNAIAIFAYGLSGSGKTFTVFGPDAVDIPEAWFKHENPHPLWGVLPRLAYDIFKLKEDTWKVVLKYFQNVIDTVRDLMSPSCEERTYKEGMRKDEDGFMDILWCQNAVLEDWADMRATFKEANAKKAISPTQFNHQSTRGHCIMTLECNMPSPTDPAMRQRGRVYVCDLAGTEPAGDIVYASYSKKSFPDGTVEYKYMGPHADQTKTKNLQNQGKKINLSLSEMAQFFMKMAQAIKAKKLKPGKSIPGCNSYFLCKYLKDTMLQARTYLFCAIRPEVKYSQYTFSTLGFAKNASVIKLQPKKASVAATPAERKLMAELDSLKLQLEEMRKLNAQLMASQGDGSMSMEKQAELARSLQAKADAEAKMKAAAEASQAKQDALMKQQMALAAKLQSGGLSAEETAALEQEQAALKQQMAQEKQASQASVQQLQQQVASIDSQVASEFDAGDVEIIAAQENMKKVMKEKQLEFARQIGGAGKKKDPGADRLQAQKEEYAERGIALMHFEKNIQEPHFFNVDEDAFRSKRFCYKLTRQLTQFGPGCDIQPMSLEAVRKHCSIEHGTDGQTLIGGKGETWHNGKLLKAGQRVLLQTYDRVVMANEMLIYRWPGKEPLFPEPTAEQVQDELERGKKKAAGKGGRSPAGKAGLTRQNSGFGDAVDDVEWAVLEREIEALLQKSKEAEKHVHLLNRDMLKFEISIIKALNLADNVPAAKESKTAKKAGGGAEKKKKKDKQKAMVRVCKSGTGEFVLMEAFEFQKNCSILRDEISRLRSAVRHGRSYEMAPEAEPVNLFFETTFHTATGLVYPEYCAYCLPTEAEHEVVPLKNALDNKSAGGLTVRLVPLEHQDDEEEAKLFVGDPTELLGKSWTYRIHIGKLQGLGFLAKRAYVQYSIFGEVFTTDTIEHDADGTAGPGSRPKATVDFGYSYVHHVPRVSKPFLEWLQLPMEFHVFTSPWVEGAGAVISSDDAKIQRRITGKVVNPEAAAAYEKRAAQGKASSSRRDEGGGGGGKKDKKSSSEDKEKASKYKKECKRLQKKNKDLEGKLAALEKQLAAAAGGGGGGGGGGKKRTALEEAQSTDQSLNNAAPKALRPEEEQAALLQQWKAKPFIFQLAHSAFDGIHVRPADLPSATKMIADAGNFKPLPNRAGK